MADIIGYCENPRCKKPIEADRVTPWCGYCGDPLPENLVAQTLNQRRRTTEQLPPTQKPQSTGWQVFQQDFHKASRANESKQRSGIVLVVIGVAVGLWAYTRVTSIYGQMHSWSPPFSEYETWTLVIGGLGAIFLVGGLTMLIDVMPQRKLSERSSDEAGRNREQDELSSRPLTETTQTGDGGQLDLKKLAKFVIGLGVVIFAYGAITYLANLPVEPKGRSGTVMGAFGSLIESMDQNALREGARSGATSTMTWGAIVGFVGIALSASAKKKE